MRPPLFTWAGAKLRPLLLDSLARPGSVVIDVITRNLVGELFLRQDLGLLS